MGEETKGLEVENHRQHTNVDEKEVKRKVNKFSRVHTCVSAWKAVSYPLCLSLSLSLTLSSKLKCRKVCFFSTLNHPIYFGSLIFLLPSKLFLVLVLVLNWVEKKRRGHRHTHKTCLLLSQLNTTTSEEYQLMVDAMFSTISMAISSKFPESMSLLFALSVEVLMVLFGKPRTLLFAEFISICCFCCCFFFWAKGYPCFELT